MGKQTELRKLALKRVDAAPAGYRDISEYHDGAYNCDHVSPYTKSAGNADSPIVFVLQDWCSDKYLNGPLRKDLMDLGYDPEFPTNKNLIRLLREHLGLELTDVYVTNLFPFIKPGGISRAIPASILERAATEFLMPQIEIIRPCVVVALGHVTFNAMRRSNGHRDVKPLAAALESKFDAADAVVWCQSHPGWSGRSNRNRGGVDRVSEDWRTMCHSLDGHLGESAV